MKPLIWMLNKKMISNLHTQLLVADQPLHFGRGEEGVMTVHRQWTLPFTVDAKDLQLPAVTGHVGGARDVHTQTLRDGAALRATVSKGFAVFCRG